MKKRALNLARRIDPVLPLLFIIIIIAVVTMLIFNKSESSTSPSISVTCYKQVCVKSSTLAMPSQKDITESKIEWKILYTSNKTHLWEHG